MTQVLVIVGVLVFFISVYGVVMVGGHLLEELDGSDPTPEPQTGTARSADNVASTTAST